MNIELRNVGDVDVLAAGTDPRERAVAVQAELGLRDGGDRREQARPGAPQGGELEVLFDDTQGA